MMAPKERDLMFIGAGVANVWNNPQEVDYFYEGYGPCKVNPILLAYYRFERIVQDIAEFLEELVFNIDTSKNPELSYYHFISMFVANGVVEIAIKSDKIKFS